MLSNDLTVCQEAIIVTASVLSSISYESLSRQIMEDDKMLP